MKNLSVIFFVLLPIIWGCKKNENKKVDIEYGTVIDNDGRLMTTVKIGDQWWMAENLQSHHFQNGDSLTVLSKEEALKQGFNWSDYEAPFPKVEKIIDEE